MIFREQNTGTQMRPAQNTYYLIISSYFSLETEPQYTLETPEDFIVRTQDKFQLARIPLVNSPTFLGQARRDPAKTLECNVLAHSDFSQLAQAVVLSAVPVLRD